MDPLTHSQMLTLWDRLTPERIQELTREQCINWLAWNDRHAILTDADSDAEGLPRLTESTARGLLYTVRFRDDFPELLDD